jgi:hypothetical protein
MNSAVKYQLKTKKKPTGAIYELAAILIITCMQELEIKLKKFVALQ